MPRRPKKNVTETASDVVVDNMIAAIKKAANPDLLFSIQSPMKTSAMRASDSQYRTIPVSTGEEMAFTDVRQGAREKLIFSFKPIDPTHSFIEFPENKVFEAFGDSFEQMIVKALVEAMPDEITAPFMNFTSAKSIFIRETIKKAVNEKRTAEEKEKQKNAEVHKDNPGWGLF